MAGRVTRENFVTVRTEGALLPVEILQRIVDGDPDLEGLTPEDYHLSKNERLNEVINRAWHRCVQAWQSFRQSADFLPDTDTGTTLTRERWLLILFQELGYGRLLTSKAQEIGGKSYPISHQWQNTPIHLISFRQELDRRSPGVAGAARFSPHSMVQEFLGRSEDHLWGIVSNGFLLRLLRDNVSLTRQSFVEFDLQAMMDGEIYSDFVLLFLLLHESRVEAERLDQCWLEKWSREAQRRGTRALDQLRDGVEKAIATLGQGFIAHPANSGLRDSLRSGTLTTLGYYQKLLRLVYRMIFLFVAEDRDLLLARNASQETRRRYTEYYALSRLRRLAGRRRGTRHGDLWSGLLTTFQCMGNGEPALGIPALNGYLFAPEALTALNECQISNDALLEALRHLSFTEDNRILRPVDYRNLGTEELGSVYESLLELHPQVNISALTFALDVSAASERRTTGSYYTPTSLIMCLLDSALQPVIQKALKDGNPEQNLLGLKIVDPATGSGHFLIAAAHRVAKHLAIVRTGESEPPPEERRKALRDVVSHCIYGVDINPLAVELCKVALWLETLDPGRPLGFLDHRIKCGNSLIGATPELLEKGIPDDAFKPIEGDDKDVSSSIRKQNREERKGQRSLFMIKEEKIEWQTTSKDYAALSEMPEDTVQQIEEKARRHELLMKEKNNQHKKACADLWTATFFWPMTKANIESIPTEAVFRDLSEKPDSLDEGSKNMLNDLSAKHRFFHWYLEYPDVFGSEGNKGFDCVLGNPPWERIKLQEKEFFAEKDPEIANAPNAAARKKLIQALQESDPMLWSEFLEARRSAEAESHYLRASGRYPFSAVGDINTYQIFAGLARQLTSDKGRIGIIVPSGIATDDTNKLFFADLAATRALVSLYDFENREAIFPAVHRSCKFCLLTIGGHDAAPNADFAFFLTNIDQLREEGRHFELTPEEIELLNPNTKTCPIFRSKKDAQITKAIYNRIPVLVDERKGEEGSPWGIRFLRMFDMTNDAHLFKTREQLEGAGWELKTNLFVREVCTFLPIYEGKMVDMYDHRAASIFINPNNPVRPQQTSESACNDHLKPDFFTTPYLWADQIDIEERIPSYWDAKWIPTLKRVTAATNERTLIGCILPRGAISYTLYCCLSSKVITTDLIFAWACMLSYPADYIVRTKTAQPSLPLGCIEEMSLPSPDIYEKKGVKDQILSRVLELTYTAYDMRYFAADVWAILYPDPATRPPLPEPYVWDENRRFIMRCELDALYFHLYGINRDDVDYILDTFSIVKRKDEATYGQYRTKQVILELFDAMADAMKAGAPYRTRLDPPPADPRCCHPPKVA